MPAPFPPDDVDDLADALVHEIVGADLAGDLVADRAPGRIEDDDLADVEWLQDVRSFPGRGPGATTAPPSPRVPPARPAPLPPKASGVSMPPVLPVPPAAREVARASVPEVAPVRPPVLRVPAHPRTAASTAPAEVPDVRRPASQQSAGEREETVPARAVAPEAVPTKAPEAVPTKAVAPKEVAPKEVASKAVASKAVARKAVARKAVEQGTGPQDAVLRKPVARRTATKVAVTAPAARKTAARRAPAKKAVPAAALAPLPAAPLPAAPLPAAPLPVAPLPVAALPAVVPSAARPASSDPVPLPPARRAGRTVTASKRQKTQLASVTSRLASINVRVKVAEAVVREAATLVSADTTALVMQSIHGARVLAASPDSAGQLEVWGVRTLAALLSTPEPVRIVLDGDPLAGGGPTSLLTAPILADRGSAGVLVCRRRSPWAFTAADQDALARLARACGERLRRTPERQTVAVASVDRATGLGGHDLLRHDLDSALAAMPRHGMPLTLLVGEVLGLARLRTSHGMALADAALSALAAQVGSGLRIGDVLYRLSADELALLLPGTGADDGAAVAARLADLSHSVGLPGGGTADLSLRVVSVPVEGEGHGVLFQVARTLKAAQVAERWAPSGIA